MILKRKMSLSTFEVFISLWSLYLFWSLNQFLKSLFVLKVFQILKSLPVFEIFIRFEVFLCFWSLYQVLKSLSGFDVVVCRWSLYQFLMPLFADEIFISFWCRCLQMKSLSFVEVFYQALKSLSVFEVCFCFFYLWDPFLPVWNLSFLLRGIYLFLKSISIFEILLTVMDPKIQVRHCFDSSNWCEWLEERYDTCGT